MTASTSLRLTCIMVTACRLTWAQALIGPGAIAAARNAFDSAGHSAHLRCQVHSVRPALDYSLQLQTGYTVDLPLSQFAGRRNSLRVLLRVTPDGGEPVYLGTSGYVPELSAGKAEAELPGSFVVGEGAYHAEVLVRDDAGRACYSQWQIQAKLSGGERDLRAATPAGVVREVGAAAPIATADLAGPRIEQLTILIHAATPNPRAALLNPETVRMLSDSVASLLTQLPSKSVRLAVFNLDKQVILLSKESFAARDLSEVTRAFGQLQPAVVDYKALQNRQRVDVLNDLVVKELHHPKPASAVIVMGPRTIAPVDTSLEAITPRPGAASWFYLEYLTGRPVMRGNGWNDPDEMLPLTPRGPAQSPQSIASGGMAMAPAQDTIERFLRRLNGTTLPIRNANDFAGAIRRMTREIGTVVESAVPPAPVAEPAPAPTVRTEVPEAPQPSEQEDPVEVLAHLRDRVLEHARGVPNHTCVETVQRDRYEPYTGPAAKSCDNLLAARKRLSNRLRLDVTDWLRLDVGMTREQEIFSWAGAEKFEEGEIDELIPEGAFGTGPFAAMLLSVFENHDPHFIFDGETTLDRRPVLEYSFRVPVDQSQYRVKAHKEWILTGFTGTLFVDPRTSDLVRFMVRTDELPPETESCEVDTTLDYSMMPIGGFEYLLPKATRQRFIGTDGSEAENDVSFASCRAFVSESTLTFGKRPEGAEYFAGGPPSASLPAGLAVAVELTSPFLFGKAAAGDRIEGRLVEAIRNSKTQELFAPAGAKVMGRLMRVELNHSGSGQYTVALRWETVETGGRKVPLSLKPVRQLGGFKAVARGMLRQRGMPIELPQTGEERYAIYHFPGQRLEVPAELRTEWVTTDPLR